MGVWAVILGILALALALMATLLFGTIGGVIAGVLGIGAIVLGVLKRKKEGKGGIGGIVIGALAIVLAVVLTGTWSGLFSELHEMAVQYKPDGLWAQVSEDYSGGLMGIFRKIPQDDATMRQMVDEMTELKNLAGK